MSLDQEISRITKLLVESEGITYDEAQVRLRSLTLEIVVGTEASSPAAHAAILTAVSVGRRTFLGGVRVVGDTNQKLNSALPLNGITLAEAVIEVGAMQFDGAISRRIIIGTMTDKHDGTWSISAWWQGWRAGTTKAVNGGSDEGTNPLSGLVAGALAVGVAFEAARSLDIDTAREVDLWPTDNGEEAPRFTYVFLPGAFWLVGLGNLGQAFLWALCTLPYANPAEVSLVLQDKDKVGEENWATSVLVKSGGYGDLKTRISEAWALKKKFDVRRVDRYIQASDRLENEDPRIALCGVDTFEARRLLADTGFDSIVDVGLGHKASDFDKYRVTVFDKTHPIRAHFDGQIDQPKPQQIPENAAYQQLLDQIGQCGTAKIAGASVAAPFVSAIAAAAAISRLIAIVSGCPCRTNETRRLSSPTSRLGPLTRIEARGGRHAGQPI